MPAVYATRRAYSVKACSLRRSKYLIRASRKVRAKGVTREDEKNLAAVTVQGYIGVHV